MPVNGLLCHSDYQKQSDDQSFEAPNSSDAEVGPPRAITYRPATFLGPFYYDKYRPYYGATMQPKPPIVKKPLNTGKIRKRPYFGPSQYAPLGWMSINGICKDIRDEIQDLDFSVSDKYDHDLNHKRKLSQSMESRDPYAYSCSDDDDDDDEQGDFQKNKKFKN